MMPASERFDLIRVGALDKVHSERRCTVVVGPLDLPSRETLLQRFSALAERGPLTRLCLEPSVTSHRWRRVPVDASAVINETADVLPPGRSPTALLPLVRALRPHDVVDEIRILCAGDQLAIDFCHGLGEVPFVHLLLDVLLGAVDPADPQLLDPYHHRLPTLMSAGLRTFGRSPRRIGTVLNGYRRRRANLPTVAPGADRVSIPFQPDPTTCVTRVPAEAVTRLRHLRDATLPDVSMMALSTYALWIALVNSGLDVHNSVKIPFDVRRYLRPGSNTLAPFTAGQDFTLDPTAGPKGLQSEMDQCAHEGRPVANLLLGTLKSCLPIPDTTEDRPSRPRVQLLHSNVRPPMNAARWPFTDRDAASILFSSDPIGAEGMTVTSSTVLGNLLLTAEFHGTVFDPDRVSAALDTVPDRVHDLILIG